MPNADMISETQAIVVAVYASDGWEVTLLGDCVSTIEGADPIIWTIFPPNWIVACFIDTPPGRDRVEAMRKRLDAINESPDVGQEISIGVAEGHVIVKIDSSGKAQTWPIGSPMSEAMKRATHRALS